MPEDKDELRERYPYHRRFIRIKLRLRVLVAAGRSLQSWTQNVSADGLCFEIPRRLEPEETVEVWLYPPQPESSPVRARCRIVWRQPAVRGFRHGAQFIEFFDEGREQLLQILDALTRPPTQPPPP